MHKKTQHFVSPNFTHEKLEPPFYKDVVDVFEDRMLNWLLVPAKHLLNVKHGSIAAVALATNYIEGIEIYASGKDSKRNSKVSFRRGFRRIFSAISGPEYLQDAVADALYDSLRCGFAHDAMFRHRIYFSSTRKEAFTITWSKLNGQFDPNGRLLSAIINPTSFIRCIELHFTEYISELRCKNATVNKENFLAAVDLTWYLGEPGPLVGMTEADFLNGT